MVAHSKNQVRATSVTTGDVITGLRLNKIEEENHKPQVSKRGGVNASKLNTGSLGPVNGGTLYARSMINQHKQMAQ